MKLPVVRIARMGGQVRSDDSRTTVSRTDPAFLSTPSLGAVRQRWSMGSRSHRSGESQGPSLEDLELMPSFLQR